MKSHFGFCSTKIHEAVSISKIERIINELVENKPHSSRIDQFLTYRNDSNCYQLTLSHRRILDIVVTQVQRGLSFRQVHEQSVICAAVMPLLI